MEKLFSNDNKVKAFDFLFNEYFKQGFGTMTKGDIDLLFFSVINKYSNIKDKRDYDLSKKLKITQARVRNLKVKEGLRYSPINSQEAQVIFLETAKFARIEDDGKSISIPIYDPNIYIELENLIELENGYVSAQLNPKVFTIKIDQFINLLINFQSKENNKTINTVQSEYLKAIKETIKKESKYSEKINIESISSFKDLQRIILEKGVDFSLDLLFDALPGGTFSKKLIEILMKK